MTVWTDDEAMAMAARSGAPPLPDDSETDGGLVLGLGCASHAGADEVLALAQRVLAQAGYPRRPLLAIATRDTRQNAPAIASLVDRLGVPLLTFSAARLEQEASRLQRPSDRVYRLTGCHGVAEAAALAAVDGPIRRMTPKRASARATAAVVETLQAQRFAGNGSHGESGAATPPACPALPETAA